MLRPQVLTCLLLAMFPILVQFQSVFSVTQISPTWVPPSGQCGIWEVVSHVSQSSKPMVCSDPYVCTSKISPEFKYNVMGWTFDSPPFWNLISVFHLPGLPAKKLNLLFFHSAVHFLWLEPSRKKKALPLSYCLGFRARENGGKNQSVPHFLTQRVSLSMPLEAEI